MAGREVGLAEVEMVSPAREGAGDADRAPRRREGIVSRSLRVLDAATRAGRAAWLRAWRAWPEREPWAHPEYVSLFARPQDRAIAILAEGGGSTVLFPLVLRPLGAERWAAPGEERWDATTPYGYGGPFAWGAAAPDGGAAFWAGYEAFCQEARIVCTFARLSLFPDQLAPLAGRVEVRGPNVVVPLAGGIDATWRGYDRDVRRRLRVARREGVEAELDPAVARLAEFHEIYAHTMERRGAAEFYRFPRSFFEGLARALPGQVLLVHAIAGGRVVSSELALASGSRVYAFLGGTRSDAFHLYPNEVVRHATAAWGAAAGKQGYVLGGGRSADDGIYRHKRLLAPGGEVPFRTACLVHDEGAYHALARRRSAWDAPGESAWTPQLHWFPVYRG